MQVCIEKICIYTIVFVFFFLCKPILPNFFHIKIVKVLAPESKYFKIYSKMNLASFFV